MGSLNRDHKKHPGTYTLLRRGFAGTIQNHWRSPMVEMEIKGGCCNLILIRGRSYVMLGITILTGYSSRTSPTVLQTDGSSPSNLLKSPVLSLWRYYMLSIFVKDTCMSYFNYIK